MAAWQASLRLAGPSVSEVTAMEPSGRLAAIRPNFGETPRRELHRCLTPRRKQGPLYLLRSIATMLSGLPPRLAALTASAMASGADRTKPLGRGRASLVR